MTINELLSVLENYDETGKFAFEDFRGYSTKAFSRLQMLPLTYLKDRLSLEIIACLMDDSFLESDYFFHDLNLIILNAENQELNFFLPYVIKEKAILENVYKVSDQYHVSDLDILVECNDRRIARHIMSLAVNSDSLESHYHNYDINLVASLDDPDLADMLVPLLCDRKSLESGYHLEDIAIMVDCLYRGDGSSVYAYIVATDEDSLSSLQHITDMDEAVNGADTEEVFSKYLVKKN